MYTEGEGSQATALPLKSSYQVMKRVDFDHPDSHFMWDELIVLHFSNAFLSVVIMVKLLMLITSGFKR